MPTLNPNDAPPGHIAVEVNEFDCKGCAFVGADDVSCYDRRCMCMERADGCNVVFKSRKSNSDGDMLDIIELLNLVTAMLEEIRAKLDTINADLKGNANDQ